MNPFVIVTDGFSKGAFKALLEIPSLSVYPKDKVTSEEIFQQNLRPNALIIRSKTQVTASLVKALSPELKLVIRAGVGVDNIDLAACAKYGVVVENIPTANNNAAAELSIGLIFSLLRHIPFAHHTLSFKREWEKTLFTGHELKGRRVGIVGMGRIGRLVAKKLFGFEVEIGAFDPFCASLPVDVYTEKIKFFSSLEELFSWASIIDLHLPSTPQTRHLISYQLLSLLGENGFLINTSRGDVIEEEGLLRCLSEGKIAGAALDVFEEEPLPQNHSFLGHSKIIVTPHLGGSTHEAQEQLSFLSIDQVRAFFERGEILNQIQISGL